MPGYNREAAYVALQARLGTVTGLSGRVFRRLPPGADAPAIAEQPCVFMPSDKEVPTRGARTMTVWRLSLELIVYTRTDDQSAAPSTALAAIVGNIETALQMQPGDKRIGIDQGSPTNLGGTCESCDMGTVVYGEGADTGQGIAFIPITILGVSTP